MDDSNISSRSSTTRTRIGDWVRARKKEVIFAFILFFVAALSFGLGYLANRELNHAPIVIEKCSSISQ